MYQIVWCYYDFWQFMLKDLYDCKYINVKNIGQFMFKVFLDVFIKIIYLPVFMVSF